MKKNNQFQAGVILSYLLLICNTFYGFIITPFILNCIGANTYGIYKTVSALSASLAVMDLGLGTTMTRYMAKFHAEDNKKEASNFVAMLIVQFSIITVLIIGVGSVLTSSMSLIYGGSFNINELKLARQLFSVLVLNMVLRLFENMLTGVISGYERFAIANGIKLMSVSFKFFSIIILLPIVRNVLVIVVLETITVLGVIIYFVFYCIKKIGIIPKLAKWDWATFGESFKYTILMFIQTLTVQFNGQIDSVLIGAQIGATSVTIYSMSLTIYGMYENLSGSIANLMLPSVTKQVVSGCSMNELQRTVAKAGRIQFFFLAAALGGFSVLGKEFFYVWLGSGYEDCYYLTLLLIVPVTIPMMQNVCLSILRAQNRMLYRTVTLSISCLINLFLTLVGINLWGYWGAAIGTMAATIANIFFMNIYYKRKLGFHVLKLFKDIVGKTLICCVVAVAFTAVVHNLVRGSWLTFLINVMIFVIVYGVMLFMLEITETEKYAIRYKLHLAKHS